MIVGARHARTGALIVALGWFASTGGAVAGIMPQPPTDSDGWRIPPGAGAEPNPVSPTPVVLARGRDLFKSKCQRCHGTSGTGNGPDADRDHPPGDLSDGRRASRNPDGVMFYKIWNGRSKPKMPAFKADLSRTDVWTIIDFVKTLRR
jgi:mono/diheme cytochrome c family protein